MARIASADRHRKRSSGKFSKLLNSIAKASAYRVGEHVLKGFVEFTAEDFDQPNRRRIWKEIWLDVCGIYERTYR